MDLNIGSSESANTAAVCPDCGAMMVTGATMACAACGGSQKVEALEGAALERQRSSLHERGTDWFLRELLTDRTAAAPVRRGDARRAEHC